MEAAQEAISSPLLDNVSIRGAQGVLLNITGGMDLAIDEVTQISTIIQEEAGDDAEIIFGAVHDPALQGKVRVTVIATGFDRGETEARVIRPEFRRQVPAAARAQEQVETQWKAAASGGGGSPAPAARFVEAPEKPVVRSPMGELDIPTFIRRQMD
jgi:cell division protein FtsZ